MDFRVVLPKSKKQNDSIMVIVDKLNKTTHFVPVKSSYQTIHIAHIFMKEIFQLHDMLRVIISYRDMKFTSTFWKALFTSLGTQIQFSMANHLQKDRQTEHVNQVLEDMLQMYVMQQPTKWEEYLHLVEFAYNNSYHKSLKMSHFDVSYGKMCRTPANWSSPEDKLMLGPNMLVEMEQTVKLDEKFLVETLCILKKRETTLRKQVIT
eukprot:PITA_32043